MSLGARGAQVDWRRAALGWTPRRWADWLINGSLQMAHATRSADRARAFAPMTISARKLHHVVELTERLVRDIPACSHNFASGLTLAFDLWRPAYGLGVLSDLLVFAETFPPENAPEIFARSDILHAICAAEEAGRRRDLAAQIVAALCIARWERGSEALLPELRTRELWDDSFLGRVFLARVAAEPKKWVTLLHAYSKDLEGAYIGSKAGHHWAVEEMVALIGLRRVVETLASGPALDDGVTLPTHTVAMAAIFGQGDPPAIMFAEDPARLVFRDEYWPTAISDLRPLVAAMLHKKYAIDDKPPGAAIIDKLHKMLAKLGISAVSVGGTPPDDITAGLNFLRGG
jgi:hypothetical protein